ncbi:unnamed protein product [Brachionus calyciflorus]|uniref:Uncharacterized protein n=1 Tax=Brachionus calyciflorus TaxID=104777 RepID=A0A814LAS0_9BILA|nr:unnamed protein product [Brachionus calyciflorus]
MSVAKATVRHNVAPPLVSDVNTSRNCSTSAFINLNDISKLCLIDTGAKTLFISYDYFIKRNFNRSKIIKPRNWTTTNATPLLVDGQTIFKCIQQNNKLCRFMSVLCKN